MARNSVSSAWKQMLYGCMLFMIAVLLGTFAGQFVFIPKPAAVPEVDIAERGTNHDGTPYGSENGVRHLPRNTESWDMHNSHHTHEPGGIPKLQTTDGGQYRIPNIIHYILIAQSSRPLEFTEYISILSAYQLQNPDQIWIHCQEDPFGRWWDQLMSNMSFHKLRVLNLKTQQALDGIPVTNTDHMVDLAKIQVLSKYGGIYLDTDVILIRSLDPLRRYPAVMGQESDLKVSPSVVLAEANATFLELMREAYERDFQPKRMDYNSGCVPYKLARSHPDLIHLEPTDLVAPPLSMKHLMYTDNTDLLEWRHLYTVHLMFHDGSNRIYDPDYIKPLKNLVGRLFRRVYYGSDADPDPYLQLVQKRQNYGSANERNQG